MATSKTHKQFIMALKKLADKSAVAEVSRFFNADPNARSSDKKILSVCIGRIFPLTKQFTECHTATHLRMS